MTSTNNTIISIVDSNNSTLYKIFYNISPENQHSISFSG